MAKTSRRKAQAFTAPKNARTKAIVAQNSKTSPLLKLPEEIRQMIWGYAIGHQTVHIYLVAAQPNMCNHWLWSRFVYLVHTVCKATISDKEGHRLCQCEDYERNASKLPPGQDLRISSNRHRNCTYNSGCEFLPLHILSVCRQFYIEASEMMWTTTTWSFRSPEVFEVFLLGAERKAISNLECFRGLNSIQKRLLKKVHIQVPQAYSKYMLGYWFIDKGLLSKAHPLDSLYLDIECSDEMQVGGKVRLPHLNDLKVTLHRNFGPLELNWNDRKAWAERFRTEILEMQAKAEEETREVKLDSAERKAVQAAVQGKR